MTSPYYNASIPHQGSMIVQGQEVKHPDKELMVPCSVTNYAPPPPGESGFISQTNNPQDFKREPQENSCRDVFWAILFYAHLALMLWVALTFIPQMMFKVAEDYAGDGGGDDRRFLLRLRFLEDAQENDNQNNNHNWNEMNGWDYYNSDADINNVNLDLGRTLSVVALTGMSGFVLSTLALVLMIWFAETLISVSIISTILLTLLSGFGALMVGQIAGALMGLAMAGLLTYYACRVWNRIPFAATNLVAATTVVRDNLGVAFYAYLSLCLTFLWAIWWTSASISALFVLGDCEGDGTCNNDISGLIIFLFFVSYYWTVQVISNVVGVTVAGVTGTWWMAPLEAASCCSKAVRDSYTRAMTYSFGSICLGSLIVALISAAKDIVRQIRQQSRDSLLVCCAEALLGCMERLAEYFNQWAFVFVGLYGFSFIEAGLEVMTLFKNRGWTNIITDDLAGRALLIQSFFVALINGIVGLLLGFAIGLGDGVPAAVSFFIGLLTGFTLCSTLFSVVGSACKSVIVLYAEAPNEFQAHHPELSERMRTSWRQAWPVDFRY